MKVMLPPQYGLHQLVDPAPDFSRYSADKMTYVGEPFSGGIQLSDVVQGALSDCYIASVAAAVAAMRPALIYGVVVSPMPQLYLVRINGKWERVDADFYVKDGKPLYGNGDLWYMALEKAFAQSVGTYQNINYGGYPSDTFAKVFGLKTESNNSEGGMWTLMLTATMDKRPTVFTTKNTAKILPGWHAFTVLEAYEKDGVKMVKLRDPRATPAPDGVRVLPYASIASELAAVTAAKL